MSPFNEALGALVGTTTHWHVQNLRTMPTKQPTESLYCIYWLPLLLTVSLHASTLTPRPWTSEKVYKNMGLMYQIWTELSMGPCQHWRSVFCMHHGGILAKKWSKGQFLFLGTLFFPLLNTFNTIRPLLLAALHFGIASLQYLHHLCVGCMQLYGTQWYLW